MPITVTHNGRLTTLKKNLSANPRKTMQVGILNNSEVAPYATYLEYGWVQRITKAQAGWFGYNYGIHLKVGNVLSLPPRPFMRGTMLAEQRVWARTISTRLMATQGNVIEALSLGGQIAVQDIQKTIASGGTSRESFARRSWITQHTGLADAYVGGHRMDGTPNNTQTDKPLMKTGLLLNSIRFEIK